MVAICKGRHPAVWKEASCVVICKPDKDNSMQLNAYRYISQLSCMGNVFGQSEMLQMTS